MNCNCNNKNENLPDVRIVQGNVLRLAIPLTLRTVRKNGSVMDVIDTDFIPSSDYPVTAVFSRGKKRYDITATMDGNIAVVEDNGTIEVGTYDITIECRDDNGNPYRFKQEATLQVVDTTAEAGIDSDIEFEVEPWYLNAAIYLATVEIGEMTEVIDQKLADVFGDVDYDSATKIIRFFNKGKTSVLGEVDARPFVADSSIEDVYIDTGRQVLVIRLNADANNRGFTVPLYLLFANYNTKAEVNNMINGIYDDLNGMIGDKASLTNGKVPYGESSAVVLDAINVSVPTNIPAWMIGKVHYCVDGKIRRYVDSGTNYATAIVSTPDPYLIYYNRYDGKFYTWSSADGMTEIETGSGGSGYQVAYSNGVLSFTGDTQPTYNNGVLTL